jgi:hypothetical protein
MERDCRHDECFVLGNPRQFGVHCSRTCSEGHVSHRKLLEKNILDTRAYICANNDTRGTYQIHRNGRLCCESCLEVVVGGKGCVDVADMANPSLKALCRMRGRTCMRL